jgi:hypothetical protein
MEYKIDNEVETTTIEKVDNGFIVKQYIDGKKQSTNLYYTRQAMFRGLKSLIPVLDDEIED